MNYLYNTYDFARTQKISGNTTVVEHKHSPCCLLPCTSIITSISIYSVLISYPRNFSVKIMRITLIICLAVCLQLAQQAWAFVPLSTCRRATTTSVSMGGGRSQAEKALTNRQVIDLPTVLHTINIDKLCNSYTNHFIAHRWLISLFCLPSKVFRELRGKLNKAAEIPGFFDVGQHVVSGLRQ